MILPGLEFYPCNTNEGYDGEAVILLLSRDGSILCPRDREILLWDASEIKFAMPPAVSEHFLGIFRGRPCYCQEVSSPDEFTLPHKVSPLFGLLGKIDDKQFDLAGRALQVINWYQDHQTPKAPGAKKGYGLGRPRCEVCARRRSWSCIRRTTQS